MSGVFVEASAGTGKTTALVNAVAEAIAGGIPVDRIAAVTFTHQAAGEMKWRIREKLEELRTPSAVLALQTLDRAFIGTIHSFCAMLLRQRPVEACVDPAFVELDAGQARRLFRDVFRRWLAATLQDAPPVLKRAFARLAWRDDRDAPIYALENAAWSLAEWRDHDAEWDKRPVDRETEVGRLLGEGRLVVAQWPAREASWARLILKDTLDRVDRARDLDDKESELLGLVRRRGLKTVGLPKRSEAARMWNDFRDNLKAFARQADADLASHLRDVLMEPVAEYGRAKRDAGQLDFTDLLIAARRLLDHDGARAELQARYERVFVDEFQDTDPLQASIIRLLAPPDKLFVVGDPKQSIYRFRRAEPTEYLKTRHALTAAGAERRELSISYRSNSEIQEFVNAAFRGCIEPYLAITGGPPPSTTQPSVIALPVPRPWDEQNVTAERILECSPPAVAGFVQWLLNESGWTVRGGRKIAAKDICILFRRFTNNGRDLTEDYVRSLESRGIRHVLVGSKGLHAREEAGIIRTCLRAIEWPEDELSVYAVLKGPLFAIPDSTLVKFRLEQKHLHPLRALPDELDEEYAPVVEALTLLAQLHRGRNARPVADTLRRLLEAVRGAAIFAFQKGGVRRLANVHRLLDMARQSDATGALTFRGFVEYLEDEARGGEAAEAPVLEQQAEGVRLMTVHKAKGMQFPVVILADLSARFADERCGRWVNAERALCAQRIIDCAPWELLDHEEEEQKAEREEAARVAYVAATRAQDLLVACAVGDGEYKDGWLSPLYDALYPPASERRASVPASGCPGFGEDTVLNAPLHSTSVQIRPGMHRPRAGEHQVLWFDPAILITQDPQVQGAENVHKLAGTPAQIAEQLTAYDGWRRKRTEAIERGSIPSVRVTVAGESRVAPDMPVEVVTVDSVAQRPAGRRFGRLLHAVLQSGGDAARYAGRFDAGADEIRAADDVAAAVRAHPLLVEEGRKAFREMPVLARLEDGTLIEGRVDLALTDGRSWTVIDYKTDRDRPRYRRQLQLYAWALQNATGLPTKAVLLEV